MLGLYKILEIGYLIMAAFFIYHGITSFSVNTTMALVYLGLAVMAIFMYFFKRNFRKKRFENQNKK